MKKGTHATTVRSLLVALMMVMIAGAAGGFYYGLGQVQNFAVEVSHATADAQASGAAIDELQELKQALAQRETLVKKANQLFATPSTYQSQALRDIQRYASRANLTIAKTDFAGGGTTADGRTFSLTLKSPVNYRNLLRFLDAIEGNLPKMQVTSIILKRPTSNSAAEIRTDDIKLTIATK